ncbi:MAG TPA: hypothetical protein DCZ03_00510 [Gammaproteobacteria bacterium]|nr:hypothetical protein [Gammaproteobacteria bacterium]
MLTQAQKVADRNSFVLYLDNLMSQHDDNHEALALVVVNINNFRRANTLFGFRAGDSLLNQIAERLYLVAVAPEMVGRLSGHTFGLIVPNLKNMDQAQLAANKVHSKLVDTFEISGNRFRTRIAMGIAYFPKNAWDAETLVEKGELALESALTQDTQLEVYTDSIKHKLSIGWDIENAMVDALDNEEFELHYQPKIDLHTGEPFAAEALLRWRSQEKGLLLPNDFIPAAEETGLIMDLTDWVLHTALRDAQEWPDKWGKHAVAVNISTCSLRESELPELIKQAIACWNFRSELLTLEITESAFMSNIETCIKNLYDIKNNGIKISVDDFGTGYSSLSQFKRIPADELKIDKSFVYDMIDDEQNKHIVELIIELGHRFQLKVVAEGIEETRTLEALVDANCDYGQGYLIGKSMDQEEYIRWLETFCPS